MGIENGLPDLLEQIGTELHDLNLSGENDGDIGRTWGTRALFAASREVFRRLRKEHVDPLHFKQVFTPTVDSSDDELYPLNRRIRQVIRVFDDYGSDTEVDYWPLATYDVDSEGWVIESNGLRLREATISGTMTIWAVQAPVRLSWGVCASGSGSTALVLATNPAVGETSLEPNYYVGARIAMETGAAKGDVRRVSSQSISSGVVTLTVPAFSSAPTGGTDRYSVVLDLPDCMSRAVVLRASLIILRTLRKMDRQLDDVAASYQEAYASGKAMLTGAQIGKITRFRRLHDNGFGSLG